MVESRDRWIKTLTELCIKSLSSSSEASNDDKVASVEDKILALYKSLNSEITTKRSEGKGIRSWLMSEASRDILVKGIYDNAEYSSDLLDGDFREIGGYLTVTIAGVVAARLDDNFELMKKVIEWCNDRLPTNYTTNKFAMLRAADYYCNFGEYRYMHISGYSSDQLPQLPGTQELDKFLEDVEKVSDDYHYRVHLFLVDAVAQLPPYLHQENKAYHDWLDRVNSYRSEEPRFLYSLSRAAYALGQHEEAIVRAIEALQRANPHDVGFIDRCRTHLLILEQEKAATETIVDKSVGRAETILESKVKESTDNIIREVEGKVSEFKDEVRNEIKSTLLTVIEILGLFLAIAGAVVASVSGIVSSDSILQSFIIYASSGVTIVVLFWLLRTIVLKPGREKSSRNATD